MRYLIHRIIDAASAINEGGRYHAFVEFAGHVNGLYIRVLPSNTVYDGRKQYPVLNLYISLRGDAHLSRLSDALTQLEQLRAPELRALREVVDAAMKLVDLMAVTDVPTACATEELKKALRKAGEDI